jgi:SAM-dependent methyltransferase
VSVVRSGPPAPPGVARRGTPSTLARLARLAGRHLGRLWRRPGAGAGLAADLDVVRYWEQRVASLGRRAVLNLGHTDQEYDAVTLRQAQEILPHLQAFLEGTEKLVLDYGCGPGRFAPLLSSVCGAQVLALDPVAALLEMAPRHPRVEYRLLTGGQVPLDPASVDVVWVSLVLGGIRDGELRRAAAELTRVLRLKGILLLAENTSEKPDLPHWHFRSVEAYRALFPGVALSRVHSYDDLGETISVMVGRKQA